MGALQLSRLKSLKALFLQGNHFVILFNEKDLNMMKHKLVQEIRKRKLKLNIIIMNYAYNMI